MLHQGHCTELGRIERYDPVFVLSLSIHSLTTGFLDPMEFAGLGLLAIALVSMGSPEDGIRKLAYEVVWRFKDALMVIYFFFSILPPYFLFFGCFVQMSLLINLKKSEDIMLFGRKRGYD